jgi:hypothetical protein
MRKVWLGAVVLADLCLAGLSGYQTVHLFHEPNYLWLLWLVSMQHFLRAFGGDTDKLLKG